MEIVFDNWEEALEVLEDNESVFWTAILMKEMPEKFDDLDKEVQDRIAYATYRLFKEQSFSSFYDVVFAAECMINQATTFSLESDFYATIKSHLKIL